MRGRNRHQRSNRSEPSDNQSPDRYDSRYSDQYGDRYGNQEQRWGGGRSGGGDQDRYQSRQGFERDSGDRDYVRNREQYDRPADENLGWPSQGPAEYRRQGRGDGREMRGGSFGNRASRQYQDPYGSDTENYGGAGYAQRSAYERMGERGRHHGKGPKGYQRSDERIREDVSEALSQHGELDATDIEVTVKSGEVTLSGTVDSRHAKRAAEDAAEGCSGVTDVQNRLRVQSTDRERGQDGLGDMSQGSIGSSGGSSKREGDGEHRARTRSPAGSIT